MMLDRAPDGSRTAFLLRFLLGSLFIAKAAQSLS